MLTIGFDLDGTLSDWGAAIDAVVPGVLAAHGFDHVHHTARLKAHLDGLHPRRDGHPVDHYHFRLLSAGDEVWAEVLDGHGHGPSVAEAVRQQFRATVYRDVVPALRALRGEARLVAISNSPRLERDLEMMEVRPYLEAAIALPPALRKPNPDGFRHAANELGMAVEDLIYVGDSLVCDVEAALEAGANPIWLDRDHTTLPVPLGAWRITSLAELPSLINAMIAAEILSP